MLLLLLIPCFLYAQKNEFSNYKIEEFTFQGHEAKVVFPTQPNKGRNWIWRARFWAHQPQLDRALLEKGFHLVHVDVTDLFGGPEAVQLWNDFYEHCKKKFKLNQKVVLEGMSRGGLIIYNWAAQNTDKVACIYADAPVCDIKSWPAGLYKGKGSKSRWELCKKAYGLTSDKDVKDFKAGGAIYNAPIVAKAKIPVIHVCGLADQIVPYEENTAIIEKLFQKEGGMIKIIKKEAVGHHPHCLKDPTPIVDFILKAI